MDPDKRARLEGTWAHQYRSHALPLIDEDRFAKYFDPGNGRPNKSVRMVVSVLILKEIKNLTDQEALEQLEWNAAWQYALDITPEEAHTCQKTLHNFRKLLLDDDEGAELFEGTTARLIEAAGLRTGRQRLDSTHIVSNIRLLTRLGLFVDTITTFLKELRKEHPRMCAQVAEELLGRYLDREGYFADARSSEAKRRLSEAAVDAYWLVERFGEHRDVSTMESFGLVQRLYEEQCVPPESEAPEKVELQEVPPSSSLQSPHDPDATYGHKGKGYEVQIAETCDEDNPFQVATAVSVNGANESDQHQVEPTLEQIERTCGKAPEELNADSNYASGENILKAAEHGTELVAPIGSKGPESPVTLGDFEIDETRNRVLQCPAGQCPIEHRPTRGGKGMLACFEAKQCEGCFLQDVCPAEPRGKDGRVIRFTPADVVVARRRVEQETPEFKERYKIRSGVEATMSESKRCHGLAKPRVRRRPRVELSARLKVLGLNIKRYVGHLTDVGAATATPVACAC
jgi:hypothetical protein